MSLILRGRRLYIEPIAYDNTTIGGVASSMHLHVHCFHQIPSAPHEDQKMYIDQQVQSLHLRAFAHRSRELFSICGFCR
jgi:hypothetical protein